MGGRHSIGTRTMRHRHLSTLCALSLAVLVGCSQPNATSPTSEGDPVDPAQPDPAPLTLQWGFHDGDQFVWTYESGMEMEGPQGDASAKGTIQLRMTFLVSVEAIQDDRFRLLYDLDQLQVSSDAPGHEIDYDSTEINPDETTEPDLDLPEDEFMAKLYESMFNSILNLEIETVAEDSGLIHELNVVGELAEVAAQSGLSSLLFLIEEDGLNSLHAGGFIRLPADEMTPDFTWEQTTDVPTRYGTIRFTHTATYAGSEVIDGVELVRFDTSISSTSISRNPVLEDLMELEGNGGSGILHFDIESGHLASYSYRSDQTLKMKGSSIGQEDFDGTLTYFTNSTVERASPPESSWGRQ